jgi:hypothetical protein
MKVGRKQIVVMPEPQDSSKPVAPWFVQRVVSDGIELDDELGETKEDCPEDFKDELGMQLEDAMGLDDEDHAAMEGGMSFAALEAARMAHPQKTLAGQVHECLAYSGVPRVWVSVSASAVFPLRAARPFLGVVPAFGGEHGSGYRLPGREGPLQLYKYS